MMLNFQDIAVSEDASADQTDLSTSPPLPYVPPAPLSLSDITANEPQDRLDRQDASQVLANPAEGGASREDGAGFEFNEDKQEEERDKSGQQQGTLFLLFYMWIQNLVTMVIPCLQVWKSWIQPLKLLEWRTEKKKTGRMS